MNRFDPLVGLPWKEGGRGEDGCDCYGLVRITFRRLVGLELGHLVETDVWTEVETPKPLDVVLMRERPWHVGIVVGRGMMLHMPERQTSVIEPYTTGRHARRVAGFYRHTSQV